MKGVRGIIFDLGGVIINLYEDRTIRGFSKLSGRPPDEVRSMLKQAAFIDFEKGMISEAGFRNAVREALQFHTSDDSIDLAWNAMLGEVPGQRLGLLEWLRKDHEVFLLSNTNAIHHRAFNEIVHKEHGHAFEQCFDKAYYSHEVHMRKPDREIFVRVLEENKLSPPATLFLDDNLLNVEGAASVGIQAIHITHPDLILQIFHEYPA